MGSQSTEIAALQAALSARVGGGPNIVCWGDSLTAQGYPAYLQSATGRTAFSAGVGGEQSGAIAARQGGTPFVFLPEGGQIPASGGVKVSLLEPANMWPLLQGAGVPGDGSVLKGTLAGVAGSLTLTQPTTVGPYHQADDYYTFTRDASGAAVPVTRPAPFLSHFAKARRGDIEIFWVGRNNKNEGSRILADIKAMVRNLSAASPNFLVVSVTNGRGEGTGTSSYNDVKATNDLLSAEYGRRYVNLRKYLVDYGLADAGLTPLQSDLDDQAADIIPGSLRSDAVHFTDAARRVIANYLATRLKEFGWVDGVTPVTMPAPPAARGANLVTNAGIEVDTTRWGSVNGAVVTRDTSKPYSGLASIKAVYSTATANSALNYANTPNRLTVDPAKTLNASFRFNGPSTLSGLSQWRIVIHCYSAAAAYLGNVQQVWNGINDWQKIDALNKTLPAGTVSVTVEWNKTSVSTGVDNVDAVTAWVDDLDIWQ